jgi:hypothetical protein
MATLTKSNPRVFKGHMETIELLADTDATWKAGQFLQVSLEGYLQACASDATQITHYALTDLDTAPGNTTTKQRVGVVTNDLIFVGNELDGTAAKTDINDAFGLDTTSKVCTLDLGDASNAALQLVDVLWDVEPLRNSSADVNARVLFRVLQSVIDATPAAAI